MGNTFPWHNLYQDDTPRDVDPDQYASIVELFLEAVAKYPDRPAFGNFGNYISYAQTAELAHNFANYLVHDCGILPGDRVAIMLPNVLAYPVAMLGALMAGAAVVNVNPQYTPRELSHQLEDSGAKVMIVLRHLLPVACEVLSKTNVEKLIYAEVGDLMKPTKQFLINKLIRFKGPKVDTKLLNDAVAFTQCLKSGEKFGNTRKAQLPTVNPTDIAFLQYTGGTTGLSKGAILSHRNIVANVLQISAFFIGRVEPGKEIVITALPLYHIYALTFNCFSFMHHGALNYLITDPRDAKRFIKEIKRIPFTAFSGVNTLYNMLMAEPSFSEVDFSHLKYAGSGGMATQSAVAERWENKTGAILGESYGLTEASPAVCTVPPSIDHFTGTIGVPLPSTECSIRDDQGGELGVLKPGELWVKGPQVMQGYWQNPEATADTITADGWLKTGDIAIMDERGLFSIVDRAKDIIIVSGFNVYPNEVEDVAVKHPAVTEAAVIGVPDDKTGEAVVLFVVSKDAAPDETDLIEFCRAELTAYKKPSRVVFVDSLPKSNVGKILRREVRDLLAKIDA